MHMAASVRETVLSANHLTAQLIENEITPKLATTIRYLITNVAHSYVTKLFVRYQMLEYCRKAQKSPALFLLHHTISPF